MQLELDLEIQKRPGYLTRIRSSYEELRNSEQKIADYISDQPQEIIHLAIAELAVRCNASEASIVRFCKHIGYKGFQDLKINIAKDTMSLAKPIQESIEEDDDLSTIKRKIFNISIQALYDSLEVLQDSELKRAIDVISNANLIEIYGTGASGPIALDAQHKFLKIGIKTLAYTDVFLQSMSASTLGEKDVVIAISYTGANLDILHSVKLAKEQGATAICITNFATSPITSIADIVLYTASPETVFRTESTPARIAQLAIIDCIFTGIALKNPEKSDDYFVKTRRSTAHKRK